MSSCKKPDELEDLYQELITLNSYLESDSPLLSPGFLDLISDPLDQDFLITPEQNSSKTITLEVDNYSSTMNGQLKPFESWLQPPYNYQTFRENWIQEQPPIAIPRIESNEIKKSSGMLDTYNYPSGIEVVLRELPAEAHIYLFPSDVPHGSKRRGYFTVAELLVLKRLVNYRFHGGTMPLPLIGNGRASGSRRGVRKATKKVLRSNCESSFDDHQQMYTPVSEQVSVIRCTSSIEGVCGVVKEAMKVLDYDQIGNNCMLPSHSGILE